MTQKVDSRPLPPAAPMAPAVTGPSAMDGVDAGLEWLWHFLSSMRVAMVIMLAIAVLGVLGSLLMQMPRDLVGISAQEAAWVDSVRPRYGGWTDLINALGFFNVFNSILFRILAAGLTISLTACSIHRIPGMVRTVRNPRVDVGPAFFEHAPQHEAIVVRRSAAEAQAVVEGVLRGRRYRTLTAEDGTVHLYADRFRLAPFAGLIAHLSVIVIMAGAIIGGMYGYRNPEFMITEGETAKVAAEPGLSIQLLDFTDKYDPQSGLPIDYASTIAVFKDGQQVDQHVVRVNDPYRYNGVTFYQAFYGPAATVTVKDAKGAVVLQSQGVPLAFSADDGARYGVLSIPNTPYTAEITATTGGSDPVVKPGQLSVGIYTNGATSFTDSRVIDQGTPAQVGDLTVTFEREEQFTGLNIARDPGVPLIWIGSFLLFAGFLVRFTIPHKRLWARIVARPNGGAVVGLATLAQKDVTAGTEFETIVSDIRTALSAPAQA
jgi:cytochrome c biogenesis protein